MGFWHTGYIEFHEYSGLGDFTVTPIIYGCSDCNFTCSSERDLRQHQFEQHPNPRPKLLFSGIELGSTPTKIVEPLSPHQVKAEDCRGAYVNGFQIDPSKIGEYLSGQTRDVQEVELIGDSGSVTFELRFMIADPNELREVDRAFDSMVKQRRLNLQAIEEFIAETEELSSVTYYVEGICSYLYGVLAKEQSPESSLAFEEHVEYFNRAIDELVAFRRSLAQTICALVSFNFNQFHRAHLQGGGGRLDVASKWYCNPPGK